MLNNVTPAVRSSVWQLKPLGSIPAPRSILPGIYALQNKASGTYVSLDMDEKNIGCWPEKDLEATGTKLVRRRSSLSLLAAHYALYFSGK